MFTLVLPTDAMMFGSGHFEDHREVVLETSTVEMTGPSGCAIVQNRDL